MSTGFEAAINDRGWKPTADAVPAFRDFVSNEKDRLLKKKQALMKNEMERRMAELVKFSQSFKVRGAPHYIVHP